MQPVKGHLLELDEVLHLKLDAQRHAGLLLLDECLERLEHQLQRVGGHVTRLVLGFGAVVVKLATDGLDELAEAEDGLLVNVAFFVLLDPVHEPLDAQVGSELGEQRALV